MDYIFHANFLYHFIIQFTSSILSPISDCFCMVQKINYGVICNEILKSYAMQYFEQQLFKVIYKKKS